MLSESGRRIGRVGWRSSSLSPSKDLSTGGGNTRASLTVEVPLPAVLAAVDELEVVWSDGLLKNGDSGVASVHLRQDISGSEAERCGHLVSVWPHDQQERAGHGTAEADTGPSSTWVCTCNTSDELGLLSNGVSGGESQTNLQRASAYSVDSSRQNGDTSRGIGVRSGSLRQSSSDERSGGEKSRGPHPGGRCTKRRSGKANDSSWIRSTYQKNGRSSEQLVNDGGKEGSLEEVLTVYVLCPARHKL